MFDLARIEPKTMDLEKIAKNIRVFLAKPWSMAPLVAGVIIVGLGTMWLGGFVGEKGKQAATKVDDSPEPVAQDAEIPSREEKILASKPPRTEKPIPHGQQDKGGTEPKRLDPSPARSYCERFPELRPLCTLECESIDPARAIISGFVLNDNERDAVEEFLKTRVPDSGKNKIHLEFQVTSDAEKTRRELRKALIGASVTGPRVEVRGAPGAPKTLNVRYRMSENVTRDDVEQIAHLYVHNGNYLMIQPLR